MDVDMVPLGFVQCICESASCSGGERWWMGGGVLAQVPFLSTCSVSLERCVRAPTNYACAREVRLPALQPAQPAA